MGVLADARFRLPQRLAGDDERHARLVYEQMIRFVGDCEIEDGVDALGERPRRAVPQIIESDFARGCVNDLARVLTAALVCVHVADNQPDADSERFEKRRVILAVARGEIIVGGEDMNAAA